MREIACPRAVRAAAVIIALGATPTGSLHAQGVIDPPWTVAGMVDASYVSATGNGDVTTVSISARLTAARAHWTLRQATALVYGTTDGVESANQLRAGARVDYRLTNRFSGFGGVTVERNAYAGFNRRVDELYGAQARALASPTDTVSVDAGGVLTQQDNTDGTHDVTPSARAAVAYVHGFGGGASFTESLEYVPDLTNVGAYRLDGEAALFGSVVRHLSVKIGYVVQFNSRPPAGFGTTDRVFTCGLQVSF